MDRIVADQDVLGGKPVMQGTRLAVEFIIIAACLAYARDVLSGNAFFRRQPNSACTC